MSYGVNINNLRTSAVPFSADEIKNFGSTLVIAPHPDDESLACGGLIAMLRSIQNQVNVIFVSDGSLSHPGSKKFPVAVLSKLREEEALNALSHLGVGSEEVFFMRLKDGSVPATGVLGFNVAVQTLVDHLKILHFDTVIMPWRRDTHQDHRASWQLVTQALGILNKDLLILEYPLWLWERGGIEDLPRKNEMDLRSVNISDYADIKLKAIHAHQSQVTKMIDDDPEGFWLSPQVIAHFTGPEEIYLAYRTSL